MPFRPFPLNDTVLLQPKSFHKLLTFKVIPFSHTGGLLCVQTWSFHIPPGFLSAQCSLLSALLGSPLFQLVKPSVATRPDPCHCHSFSWCWSLSPIQCLEFLSAGTLSMNSPMASLSSLLLISTSLPPSIPHRALPSSQDPATKLKR